MDYITITETGCYLDNHRGHYLSRDAIQFAEEHGFIVGPMEQWAIHTYEKQSHEDSYPFETLIELCDEAIAWLNSGQDKCIECHGTGKVWARAAKTAEDMPPLVICKACSGSGRGPRISGQNFPPHIPEGTHWAFEDGDFGLWYYDDDGNVIDTPDLPAA